MYRPGSGVYQTSWPRMAIIAQPTPAWLAVIGLTLFSALVLVLAGFRIRRMEIAYGTD